MLWVVSISRFYLIQSFLMAYKKDYQQLEAYNLLQMLQQEGVQSLLLGIYKHQIQMKYNYDRKISQRSNHLIFDKLRCNTTYFCIHWTKKLRIAIMTNSTKSCTIFSFNWWHMSIREILKIVFATLVKVWMHIVAVHDLFSLLKFPHITQYPLSILTCSFLSEINFIL